MMIFQPRGLPLSEYLNRKSEVMPSGCIEWRGARRRRGYGRFAYGGYSGSAHRAAYEISKGPIPPGMCVLHSCDNPSCINPDHLSIGDAAQNAREREERGRGPPRKPKKISNADVLDAISEVASGSTLVAAAKKRGVTGQMLSQVISGKHRSYLLKQVAEIMRRDQSASTFDPNPPSDEEIAEAFRFNYGLGAEAN